MKKEIKKSQISGEGYGSSHTWIRGGTNYNPSGWSDKYTQYGCECGACFTHYYDVTPDIFQAIEQVGISDKCPLDLDKEQE